MWSQSLLFVSCFRSSLLLPWFFFIFISHCPYIFNCSLCVKADYTVCSCYDRKYHMNISDWSIPAASTYLADQCTTLYGEKQVGDSLWRDPMSHLPWMDFTFCMLGNTVLERAYKADKGTDLRQTTTNIVYDEGPPPDGLFILPSSCDSVKCLRWVIPHASYLRYMKYTSIISSNIPSFEIFISGSTRHFLEFSLWKCSRLQAPCFWLCSQSSWGF